MSLIRGSLHRRKGAASHIIHMVCPYRSPFPVGMTGSYICSYEDYLPSRRLERKGGGSQYSVVRGSKSFRQFVDAANSSNVNP
jgi:hypothetical protein